MDSQEYLIWALACFVFSAFFAGMVTILQEVMKKLARKPPAANAFRWGFFGYCGWFSTFLGLGMALSAIWRG